jgi:hypothetical protein
VVGLLALSAVSVQAVEIASRMQGATLAAPDYDWWYGCSPTSAGMMLGYYDRNGYGGQDYSNIVPGAVAEMSTFTAGPADAETKAMIASQGHIDDFYSGLSPSAGYGLSGDDVAPPWHSFDSLADFMGTSQDSQGNSNGSTSFWYYTNGAPLHYYELPGYGIQDDDGCYGIYEYLAYCGYGGAVVDAYTQLTDNVGATYGFTVADYQAEINAGRLVIIHVTGHSMLGHGYGVTAPIIDIHDTWNPGPHSMMWGGSYSGLEMWGVTVLELTAIPEPSTIVLLGLSLVGTVLHRRRRTAA